MYVCIHTVRFDRFVPLISQGFCLVSLISPDPPPFPTHLCRTKKKNRDGVTRNSHLNEGPKWRVAKCRRDSRNLMEHSIKGKIRNFSFLSLFLSPVDRFNFFAFDPLIRRVEVSPRDRPEKMSAHKINCNFENSECVVATCPTAMGRVRPVRKIAGKSSGTF